MPKETAGGVKRVAVYIEYVLLDNIVIDYLLLKYTFKLVGGKSGFRRLFFCAFLGAAFAAAMPLVPMPLWASVPVKALFSAALVWAAGSYATKKSYFLSFAVFNLYTFLLGGSVTGIFNLFALPLDREYSVGLIVLAAYVSIRLMHKGVAVLYRRKNVYAYVSDCEITLNGTTVRAKGFLDTGNNLYDSKTDSPVVICSRSVAFRLSDNFRNKLGGRKMKIVTAAGESEITVFKIDRLKIYNGDKANIYDNVLLGVAGAAFRDGGYDLIIHSEMIGGLGC